jgi:excisionase family DNA binding protein
MRMEWLSIAEAAEMLGVSERHVRRLASSGALRARRFGSHWMVERDDVRQRARIDPSPGRPLSPLMAWNVLQLADRAVESAQSSDEDLGEFEIDDRRLRYRIRSLLPEAPPPDQWGFWLRNRAIERPVWIHPGVRERFANDKRLRPGGSAAVVAAGVGIAAGGPARFYVDERDLEAVLDDYGARLDDEGDVTLMVIPSEVPNDIVGASGQPVAAAVGLVDLLGSDDARERFIARDLLRDAVRELSGSGRSNGSDKR